MEWIDKKDFVWRGTLSKVAVPDSVHRASWAHGYQVGLHDAVRFGSIWWLLKYALKTRYARAQ